ncbi:nucleotidyltransferase family protein [Bacillota bacterium]
MLSVMEIKEAVSKIAPRYPIKNVYLFGTYAAGNAHRKSDVDVLVEFDSRPVTLLDYCGFWEELSDALRISADIVKYPLSADSKELLMIDKVVPLYEQ